MHLRLEVDGAVHEVEAQAGAMLLEVLRRAGFWSVKHGCETGDCGACLVLVDGEPRLSCIYPAAKAPGHAITTAEALGDTESLHPLQRAFLERGAVQCGYCTPAMLLAAEALLRRDPHPDEAAVRQALAGVLCRCTGYLKPVEAVLAAAAAGATCDGVAGSACGASAALPGSGAPSPSAPPSPAPPPSTPQASAPPAPTPPPSEGR